jgi:cell division protein FtsL
MAAFLFHLLTKLLVFLFLAGLVGSAVVILITFFEDGQLLMERDEAKLRSEPENLENATPTANTSHKTREAY